MAVLRSVRSIPPIRRLIHPHEGLHQRFNSFSASTVGTQRLEAGLGTWVAAFAFGVGTANIVGYALFANQSSPNRKSWAVLDESKLPVVKYAKLEGMRKVRRVYIRLGIGQPLIKVVEPLALTE